MLMTSFKITHPNPHSEYMIQSSGSDQFEIIVVGGEGKYGVYAKPYSGTYEACERWLEWEVTGTTGIPNAIRDESLKNHNVVISQEVLEVLSAGRCEGNKFYFAPVQLDRKLYEATKKILEMMEGKWKGGKVGAFVFSDEAADVIDGALASGEVLNWRKMRQFYATPRALAEKLVAMAGISENDSVLEPSAGTGAILSVIAEKHPEAILYVVEVDEKNQEQLKKAGFKINGTDFLEWNTPVDKIVANPPFSKHQDIRHIRHMWDVLNPGGTLVSVASSAVMFNQDNETTEFRNFVAEFDGEIELLPKNTFKDSGTLVNACVVRLNKPF